MQKPGKGKRNDRDRILLPKNVRFDEDEVPLTRMLSVVVVAEAVVELNMLLRHSIPSNTESNRVKASFVPAIHSLLTRRRRY